MKHIILSILMVVSIGISLPSVTVVNAQEKQIDFEYEVMATAPANNYGINAFKPILPTPEPLDVKRLYLRNYYMGLIENFGENSFGSCSYIALEMMLSYYDSYLCDDIIPEQYDVASTGNNYDIINRNNSPGTLNDMIAENYGIIWGLSRDEYYEILKEKFGETSLHFRLIEISKEQGVVNWKPDSYSLNWDKAHIVLAAYLSEQGFRNADNCFIKFRSFMHGDSSDEVKKFIMDNIDLGYPVYVAGASEFGGGHSFVCYDYDDIDNIYAHMGWHDYESFHVNPFAAPYGYELELSAMTIEFQLEHTHSYNYMVGDKAYCYCDEAIETYHNHNYETCLRYSNKLHRTYCKCGKYKEAAHWIRGSVSTTICAACGATLDPKDGPFPGIWSLGKTPNGSYISQSGIPVIMDGDVEAYLNGTLKFGSGLGNYDYI